MSDSYQVKRRQARASLSDALDDLLVPIASSRKRPLERLMLAWPAICGHELAQCTQPIELNGNSLTVQTHDEHWGGVTRSLRKRLLEKVRQIVPAVTRIETKVEPIRRTERRIQPFPEDVLAVSDDTSVEEEIGIFLSAWRSHQGEHQADEPSADSDDD